MKSALLNYGRILLTALLVSLTSFLHAQDLKNWFNEDPELDRHAGVSSDRTYKDYLYRMESHTVIVAVIDGGTDVNHPDLKDNIWINEDEIPGNGIDDDNNGYIDDINGWNFIGGKEKEVGPDNLEVVRVYNNLKGKYGNGKPSSMTTEEKQEYETFLKAKKEIDTELAESKINLAIYDTLMQHMKDIKLEMGGTDFTGEQLMKTAKGTSDYDKIKIAVASALQNDNSFEDIYADFKSVHDYFYDRVNYNYNVNFDPRDIVGDNYNDYSEKGYGNNNVTGPEAEHGTHVAGIIGAIRNNNLGMNGVAQNVKLMILRTVPNGDERDKDVANAIRYAADNGATVINMSFGKSYSPGKKYVDDAVRYAASKDVLFVHGAGNDNANIDKESNFPSPFYLNGESVPGWIEVGAITSSGDITDFSNYGAKTVDILAPGQKIYSTIPGGEYKYENGTSMAAPVVAGVAAIIRSYFPGLKADQVKTLITTSAIKPKSKTVLPGSKNKKVKYKKLCSSAGWANVYTVFAVIETIAKKAQSSDKVQ